MLTPEGVALRLVSTPSQSLASVRRRIYGNRLDAHAFSTIIKDVVAGRYADVHLSAFLTACSAFPLDVSEAGTTGRHTGRAFYTQLSGGFELLVGRDVEALHQFADDNDCLWSIQDGQLTLIPQTA